jgi:hypothetical protein
MQAYYACFPDYPAFHATSEHPLAILEFGAGRSGFPTWLRQQLESAAVSPSGAITCQDVTDTNRIHINRWPMRC